jgi:RNA polymerase sigma-70 factor (ECF subfamily)
MSTVALSDVTVEPLEQQFDQIFREHYQLVYRTAYGVTGRVEDAEDVLQTIFLRLLRREIPPDLTRNPKAYLYRAAVNVSLNTVRLRQRHVLTDDAERFDSPAPAAETNSLEEIHKRLYEAIAKLDPESAQIIILRYVHNYSDAEIAKLLGKSRGVIAVRLFRLRARLRKLIGAPQGDK